MDTEDNKNKSIKKPNKNNQKIIDSFLKRNAPKKVENKKDKDKDKDKVSNINDNKFSPKKNNSKKKNINIVISPKDKKENVLDFNKFKKENNTETNKRKNSLFDKNNSPSKEKDKNKDKDKDKEKASTVKDRRSTFIRSSRKIEDTAVPVGVTEAEINTAIKTINIGQKIPKRYSPMREELKNYDNRKFDKYDEEQMRYELIKDYSNLQPNKDNGFLQRMQFDSLKRKNRVQKVNELLEKNKYKIDEGERNKIFNRLVDDSNRRIQEKKEKERDTFTEENNVIKEQSYDEEKKYNDDEWNEIYQKRFKEFEEYKKKRIEIKREKEKIQKMIEEQEEMNKMNTKKLPEYKIRETSQRLYDEAKRRTLMKNRKMQDKDKNKTNNVTSFNDEEDASKYMKSFKSEYYNFNGNSETNSNYFSIYNNEYNQSNQNNQNNQNDYRNIINLNNNLNDGFSGKSVEKKNVVQRFNKINPNEINGRSKRGTQRGNTKKDIRRKNRDYYYPINDKINLVNNFTFKSDNNSKDLNKYKKYDDFKRNRIENDFPNQRINIKTQYPRNNYNYNNRNGNGNGNGNEDNENYNYKKDNIVDNYLYNYCINRYFDKNSL